MFSQARRCLLLALIALACGACSLGGDSEDAAETETQAVDGAQVVATFVPTCDFISYEEVGDVLGVAVAPLESAPSTESCEFTTVDRRPVLGVRIERGQTSESVRARIGASGDVVEEIAVPRQATWAPSRGALTALYEDAFVQLVLPDSPLPAPEQRDRALVLLERVVARLAAFIPGAERDVAGRSYVDNLIAKEESGEWSIGDGLLATLRLFAGEVEESAVLRSPDLESLEITGLMTMAREYASDGEDADTRAAIVDLLDRLSFTPAELDAIARPAPRPAAARGDETSTRSRHPAAARQTSEDCEDFYGAYAIPAGVDTCLLVHTQTTGGIEFRIYEPGLAEVDTGWSDTFVVPTVTLVRETIDETVEQTFLTLGSLPGRMLVVLAASKHHRAAMQAVPDEEGTSCTVTVYLGAQSFAPSDFNQLLAHEFAHCFQNATFPQQQVPPYKERLWREEGLAEYLGAVAYPETNEERRFVDLLRTTEIETATVFTRGYENVVWFHYLRQTLGSDEAIFELVRNGPTTGTVEDQQAYLASQPGMEDLHHEFSLATTDGAVRDLDGSTYPPGTSYNAHGATLAEGQKLTAMFQPFGVGKFVFTVPKGMAANLELVAGDGASVSARPFASPGDWFPVVSGDEFLAPCEEDQSFVLVASSASQETTFTLEVAVLEEYDCEECVVGEWRLELPEPFLSTTAPFLGQRDYLARTVAGSVDLSIFDDGSIDIEIDDYREVLEFELYDLVSTSSGRASGRWEIQGGELSAGYEGFDGVKTTTETTGSGFTGTQNVPPSHVLLGRAGPYTCDEERLVYANPDGPIVSYARR